jgi:hypothetical protein
MPSKPSTIYSRAIRSAEIALRRANKATKANLEANIKEAERLSHKQTVDANFEAKLEALALETALRESNRKARESLRAATQAKVHTIEAALNERIDALKAEAEKETKANWARYWQVHDQVANIAESMINEKKGD